MRFKKILATCLVVASMTMTSQAAFAKEGFADTLHTASEIWLPGYTGTSVNYTLDSTSDYDFFLANNRYGGSEFIYKLSLQSPSTANYDVQLITVDSNNNIVKTFEVPDSGGSTDVWHDVIQPGHKLYMKVSTRGHEYDRNNTYNLIFRKYG
ncbi:hypothetical protein [Paenibacillus sp. 481]|uniref:hypothetical protein n=1 Tax=Paenibacillus sp. 481 TaxID=2835869 RepID=UPI001E5E63AE|nr:hypothetical protein [Paenibacillus sp. 481]UHA71915.1 hypothetical protein KIK04_14350 [Paenibacillus sp. 481]